MKRMAYLSIAIAICISSCSGTEDSPLQEIPPPDLNTVTIGGETYDFSRAIAVQKSDFDKKAVEDFVFAAKLELLTEDAETINQSFVQELSISARSERRVPVTTVLYTATYSENITANDIVGVSQLYRIEGGYTHKLFVPGKKGFYALPEFESDVSSFSTYDFDILLAHLTKDMNDQSRRGHIMIMSDAIYNLSSNVSGRLAGVEEEPMPSLSSQLFLTGEISNPIAIYPDKACAPGCPIGPESGCNIDQEGGAMCDDCIFRQLDEFSNDNQLEFRVYQEFSTDDAYQMRDDYMAGNPVGNKYKKYYYNLSYFAEASGAITLSNFGDHVNLIRELYAASNKLQFGTGSEIVVTPELYNQARTLINQYRNLSRSTEVNVMLTDIEQDLNTYYGKPKSFVEMAAFTAAE